MSQHASELCTLLVEDIYGDLTARVFTILLRHGRLHLSLLIHHTNLSLRQVKHALAVLIQQHLVHHHKPPEGDLTFYEADWRSAYDLVRPGKIAKLVEDRYGNIAGGVISNLLSLGHARVDDLAAAYGLDVGEIGSGVRNGVAKVKANNRNKASGLTLGELHTTIHTLLQAGFLTQVEVAHFRSVADNRNEAERIVRSRPEFTGRPRGTKEKASLEAAIQKQLKQWQNGVAADAGAVDGNSRGRKRPMGMFTSSGSEKRMKLDNGFTSSQNGYAGDDDIMFDGNLVLRINHEKITVAFRSQRLVELAERRIGKTTSQIYAEVLRQLERNIQRCQTEPTEVLGDDDEPASLPSISTSELSSLLFQDLDFMGAIGEPDVNRLGSKRPQFRKKQEKKYKSGDEALAVGNASPDESDEEDMDDVHVNGHHPEADGTLSMDDADPILDSWDEDDGTNGRTSFEHRRRMSKIKQHLHLLAEDPLEFVQIVEKYGELNEWAVDFAALTEQLRQLELENTITSRFGPAAARMVRIFLDKGKLDEKQITNLGLIHQKQMRAVLTIMHEAGHLELQEVPRDNSRQPSRTMYLWYFEPERCRQLVLEETYKAMARCLQRVKVERLAIQALIDKAERTDVVGKEEQYLSINERVVLSRWREKEARLLGEVGRLDDLAGVLRDY